MDNLEQFIKENNLVKIKEDHRYNSYIKIDDNNKLIATGYVINCVRKESDGDKRECTFKKYAASLYTDEKHLSFPYDSELDALRELIKEFNRVVKDRQRFAANELEQFIKNNNLKRNVLYDYGITRIAQYTKIIDGIFNVFGYVAKKENKYSFSFYDLRDFLYEADNFDNCLRKHLMTKFQYNSELDALQELVKCVNIIINFQKEWINGATT